MSEHNVTREYEMFSVRTYITYENYITHENMMSGVRTYVTCKNAHFSLLFQKLDLGIASAVDKLHLAIPVSRYCQY